LDVTQQPDFLTRGFFAWENRGDPQFLLWMARNRMNFWCVEQRDHPLMRKLGIQMGWGQHLSQAMFFNPASESPYDHASFNGNASKPKDKTSTQTSSSHANAPDALAASRAAGALAHLEKLLGE
jgi:hypothetical protein